MLDPEELAELDTEGLAVLGTEDLRDLQIQPPSFTVPYATKHTPPSTTTAHPAISKILAAPANKGARTGLAAINKFFTNLNASARASPSRF